MLQLLHLIDGQGFPGRGMRDYIPLEVHVVYPRNLLVFISGSVAEYRLEKRPLAECNFLIIDEVEIILIPSPLVVILLIFLRYLEPNGLWCPASTNLPLPAFRA